MFISGNFRGNPDKCDLAGNTCLHHAAATNMLHCGTFLVNFGTNLWTLNNDFHKALDVAAIAENEAIVTYLDTCCSRQSQRNPKTVRKLKEKAHLQALKRCKKAQKMQRKFHKKQAKVQRKLGVIGEEGSVVDGGGVGPSTSVSAPASFYWGTTRSRKSTQSQMFSETKQYSDHFNTMNVKTRKFVIGPVVKKMKRKNNTSSLSKNSDFVVTETITDGTKTVRSLVGIKRDQHVLYTGRNASTENGGKSKESPDVFAGSMRMRGFYNKDDDVISRSVSEPDFVVGQGNHGEEEDEADGASIFYRPGMGEIAFLKRHNASMQEIIEENNNKPTKNGNHQKNKRKTYDTGSIGTCRSLVGRMHQLSIEEEVLEENEATRSDDVTAADVSLECDDVNSLECFLVANKMSEYFELFQDEDVSLVSLMLLNDDDLAGMGLKLGPRRRLLDAVARRQEALDANTNLPLLEETWL